MKRQTALVASAGVVLGALALAPVSSAQPMQQPPPHNKGLPDLVITQFGLTSWGRCAPGKAVFTFTMTVKNQGDASWTGESNVYVRDLKKPGWFTSVALQPLARGESRTVAAPVYFYIQDPAWMSAGSPHPFQATVNDNHMPVESDYANNAGPGTAAYMGKKVINVSPPKNCGK